MQHVYDVTIIGGGPAGLYSAFYSGLRGLKTKLLESQPQLGGKVLLYPEKLIWDIGGHPPVLGEQFVKQLIEQAKTFDPTILTGTKVDLIERHNDIFVIHTAAGEKHYSKTVLLAVGGGIISPQKLTLEGAENMKCPIYITLCNRINVLSIRISLSQAVVMQPSIGLLN